MTDAAMLQKIRVSTNSPTTDEPIRRAHSDFSPVRAFIFTRIQELMVWPARNASSEARTICGTGPSAPSSAACLEAPNSSSKPGSAMITQ
ncbi:hypothetical protein D3C85_1583410 [compost metagenome]